MPPDEHPAREPPAVVLVPAADQFNAIIGGLKAVHDGLFETGFRITTALVVVLGWFAADENPLPQLCGSFSRLWMAMVALLGGFLAACYLYLRDFDRARTCENALATLKVKQRVYKCYRVTRSMVYVGLAVQLAMFGFVAATICIRYGFPDKDGSTPCQVADKREVRNETVVVQPCRKDPLD